MMKGLSSLFFSYDTRRRTKKGRPRGGSVTENTINHPVRPCLKRGPEAGSIAEKTDFHGPGDNIWVHARFYRTISWYLQYLV
jgi:hypothetical protein